MGWSMNKNIKIRLLIVGIGSFLVISLLTAIAGYSVYQGIDSKTYLDSRRIAEANEEHLQSVLKQLKYLHLINYENSYDTIIKEFKNYVRIIYANDHTVNGYALVNLHHKQDEEAFLKRVRAEYLPDFSLTPVTKAIPSTVPSQKSDFNAVVLYRYPDTVPHDVRGLELASGKERYNVLTYMNSLNEPVMTAPLKVMNDAKENEYSAIIYYPLVKKNRKKGLIEWVVVAPFTFQTVLDSYRNSYRNMQEYHVELYDVGFKEETLLAQTGNVHYPGLFEIVKSEFIKFSGRTFRLEVHNSNVYTFANYWQVMLGFVSGILFLVALLYYLYFRERKQSEIDKLRAKLLQAQEIATLGHFTWLPDENNFICSDEMVKLFALSGNHVSFSEFEERIHIADKEMMEERMQQLVDKSIPGQGDMEFRIEFQNAEAWVFVKYSANYDAGGKLVDVFGVAQDITSRKYIELEVRRHNEHYQKLAIMDSLTGVYNRHYFNNELKRFLSELQRYKNVFSVILFDIDRFKFINDTYGHNEGDRVLKELAALIKGIIRESDVLCRWGGEEFVIIMNNTDVRNAIVAAEKFRQSIEDSVFLEEWPVTCSFGVIEAKKDDDSKSLIHRADEAMYAAKKQGRNKVATL